MKPIQPGDRGPAVEDIQRRLRTLGYDLGRAGIDGIFLGATAQAVAEFQAASGTDEQGVVGESTWAALVDATFTLGDRMLYLRVPHFHGRDVRVLQEALNALGFANGACDGIFGTFTERAVQEFQRNSGLPADGIVGPETVRALVALRHVWEGKSPLPHSAARLAPARASETLSRARIAIGGANESRPRVAARVVNLAKATTEDAAVWLIGEGGDRSYEAALTLRVCEDGTAYALKGRPVVAIDGENLVPRLVTAIAVAQPEGLEVVVELGDEVAGDERQEQRAAVVLLDALCALEG
jgi:hypothetical protein